MVSEAEHRILIVEDDLDVAEMLEAYFRVQGYGVTVVNWGEDAIKACRTQRPSLVLLDIRLPDINGYQVAQRLRSNQRTVDIPIIFLTEKRERSDRLQGLELGADDYITKPFDIQELRLRVRNALHRSSQESVNHPVTGLPDRALVEEMLVECLDNQNWAIILITLENLESFRETYGFVAADDAIRAIGLLIKGEIQKMGHPSDFLGHLERSRFVVVTKYGSLETLRKAIQSKIEQSLDFFYPLDSQGKEPNQYLAIRACGVVPEDGPFNDLAQLKKVLLSL